MIHVLADISAATVDWSRAQFALTAIYHWLFVPLTLGVAVIMALAETQYYRTNDLFWKDVARFWQKLFGINFAMGVATGIILEFEFGTNWSNYSWMVGDVFGAPLAIEGIVAFFMESTFVAVMFFGWDKVSRGFHLASTWLTGIGATLSAWWILVANAWMQYPVGQTFNPDTMRFEMTSFLDVALSPVAVTKFFHTVTSSWIVGAAFVVGVSGWYLYKRRETRLALASVKIGAAVGLAASLLAAYTGDQSAYQVAQHQPMKLAAMEALYRGGECQGLTLMAAVHPLRQPDYTREQEPPFRLAIPKGLSLLATRSLEGYVPGVNDILQGYTRPDGVREPSAREKMERGRKAIVALQSYREAMQASAAKDSPEMQHLRAELTENLPYFGYGYIREESQLVPHIPINFYAFRLMVGLGCLFILFYGVVLVLAVRGSLPRFRWINLVAVLLIPLAYVASESGWIVAEMGRQPWTIQDMLPVGIAVSDIPARNVAITFFIFLFLFTLMFAVEIRILWTQILKGPDYESIPLDSHA